LSQLLEIIKTEIKNRGAITFEEFMRLALYCPVYGFYEKEEDRIGRNGDFYTSVSVGDLFGELLAFQFTDWFAECQSGTRPVQIVEAGAHRGDLARDILIWLRDHRADFFENLQYVIVEPSQVRKKWQSATLAEVAEKVTWLSHIRHRASGFHGIIFANELLDAMPVRRFGWNAQKKEWFEWGVSWKHGKLFWTRLRRPDNGEALSMSFESNETLLAFLPDGFAFELCSEGEAWWREAAQALEWGKLMTIDYGATIDELVSPERKDGTLRGYYHHHLTTDLLANPGEQDLTAHVNFTALITAGEKGGLETEKFETQAQFLTKIAAQGRYGKSIEQWSSSRARQFQTLTHPEHLGRSFRVLVQSRNGMA